MRINSDDLLSYIRTHPEDQVAHLNRLVYLLVKGMGGTARISGEDYYEMMENPHGGMCLFVNDETHDIFIEIADEPKPLIKETEDGRPNSQ